MSKYLLVIGVAFPFILGWTQISSYPLFDSTHITLELLTPKAEVRLAKDKLWVTQFWYLIQVVNSSHKYLTNSKSISKLTFTETISAAVRILAAIFYAKNRKQAFQVQIELWCYFLCSHGRSSSWNIYFRASVSGYTIHLTQKNINICIKSSVSWFQ